MRGEGEGVNIYARKYSDSRNIFMQMSLGVMSIENLNETFINPALRNMFPDYAKSFNYSSLIVHSKGRSPSETRIQYSLYADQAVKVFNYPPC